MIYSFQGYIPVVHESSFVHPLAAVTGNVIIGKNCYIGPHASLRGDYGHIVLEDGVNFQDSCVAHGFPNGETRIKHNGHVSHGAVRGAGEDGSRCAVSRLPGNPGYRYSPGGYR